MTSTLGRSAGARPRNCAPAPARGGAGGVGASGGLRVELDREAVDAVAGVLRRHVLAAEHVAQVGVAVGAADLGAGHAVGEIVDLFDRARDGVVERRPAAVRVELVVARVEGGAARAALVHALGLGVDVLPGPGGLGAGLAQDTELVGGEAHAPLLLGRGQGGLVLCHTTKVRRTPSAGGVLFVSVEPG